MLNPDERDGVRVPQAEPVEIAVTDGARLALAESCQWIRTATEHFTEIALQVVEVKAQLERLEARMIKQAQLVRDSKDQYANIVKVLVDASELTGHGGQWRYDAERGMFVKEQVP